MIQVKIENTRTARNFRLLISGFYNSTRQWSRIMPDKSSGGIRFRS
jgi:hypothetical protein